MSEAICVRSLWCLRPSVSEAVCVRGLLLQKPFVSKNFLLQRCPVAKPVCCSGLLLQAVCCKGIMLQRLFVAEAFCCGGRLLQKLCCRGLAAVPTHPATEGAAHPSMCALPTCGGLCQASLLWPAAGARQPRHCRSLRCPLADHQRTGPPRPHQPGRHTRRQRDKIHANKSMPTHAHTHTHTHLYLRTQTHPHVHMHKRTHTARGAALTSDSAFRSSELCEPWGAPPAPALPLSLSSSSDTTSTAASARALEQRSKDKTWKGTQGHKDQHCPALRHNILHQPLEPCQTVAAGARRWSTRRRHLSRAPCSNAILRSELGSERWVDPCCCYCCTRAAGLGSGLQVCIAAAAAAADASAQAQLEWKCTAQGLNHSLYEHSVPTAYGACTKGMLEGRRAHNGAHAHLSVSTGLEQHGTAVRMCLKYCIRCQRSLFTASASVERNSSQLQR